MKVFVVVPDVTNKNWLDVGCDVTRVTSGLQLSWRRFALSQCFLFATFQLFVVNVYRLSTVCDVFSTCPVHWTANFNTICADVFSVSFRSSLLFLFVFNLHQSGHGYTLSTSPNSYWSKLHQHFTGNASLDKKVTVKFCKSMLIGYEQRSEKLANSFEVMIGWRCFAVNKFTFLSWKKT